MGFLMLKDHKSAIHLEGVTFDKFICNSNGTEKILNFLLFNNCQLAIMRLIHSFDNMFLFSNHNGTHMNVSKQNKENRGVRAFLTIRKHQINLLPSKISFPKFFRSPVQYRSLILWEDTVNLVCVTTPLNTNLHAYPRSLTITFCPLLKIYNYSNLII